MRNIFVAAAAGAVAAIAVMAAFYLGMKLSPATLMATAAALTVGAAAAMMTRLALDAPAPKNDRERFLAKRIRDVRDLIDPFPRSSGTVKLLLKPDTIADDLEVVKHPEDYLDKEIIVTIKEGNKTFNPVMLKRIFLALKKQPNFVHLILVDKHDEFVGYIPSLRAKADFTGPEAEVMIARFIVDVLADHNNSANLRAINGLASTDTISDEEHLSRALDKMQGGYLRLVVLRNGYHRKPIGLLHSERLVSATKAA